MVDRTTRRFGLGVFAVVLIVGAVYGVRTAMRADANVEPVGIRCEPEPVTTEQVLPDDALFAMSQFGEDSSFSYDLLVRKDGYAELSHPILPMVVLKLTDDQLRDCVQECLDRGLATMKPSSKVLHYSPGTFYRLSLNAVNLRISVSTWSGDAAAKPLEDLITAFRRIAGVDAALAARAANRRAPESQSSK